QMLEESFSLGLIPELIETLALDGGEPIAGLASAWMKRFDEAHGMPGDLAELELDAPSAAPKEKARATKAKSAGDMELPPGAIDRLAALLRGGGAEPPALDEDDDEPHDEPAEAPEPE